MNRVKARDFLPEGSKDQHILTDETILETLVECAGITSSDTVLEVGGGPGNLTAKIAGRAGKVYVVERERKYVEILREKFRSGNVCVIEGNVLRVELPPFNKIVSSLPYSISEPLFFFLVQKRRITENTMILSENFVERIVASPSSLLFGRVSALFLAFFQVEVRAQVPREAFYPPPRVDSVCVKITPKLVEPSPTLHMLQRLFLYDRKTVKNVLRETLWNHGVTFTGRPLTRREANALVSARTGTCAFLDKRITCLSNEEIRTLVPLIVDWKL